MVTHRKAQQKPEQKPVQKQSNNREAPEERQLAVRDVFNPIVSTKQLAALIGRPPEWAIRTRPGPGNKKLRYVPHGWVTDQLNVMFGFDWDRTLIPMDASGSLYTMQVESIDPPPGARDKKPIITRHLTVCVRITARVHGDAKNPAKITGILTKDGIGSQLWNQGIEFGDALKGATSDGLKVAASQFGIANTLYYDEQAEMQAYNEKMNPKADADDVIDAQVIDIAPPTNIGVLIARAQSELSLNFEQVQSKLKLDMAGITAQLPENAQKLWDTLKDGKNA